MVNVLAVVVPSSVVPTVPAHVIEPLAATPGGAITTLPTPVPGLKDKFHVYPAGYPFALPGLGRQTLVPLVLLANKYPLSSEEVQTPPNGFVQAGTDTTPDVL